MGLRLQSVSPRQGWRWFADGFRLFWRKPMAFAGLFMMFLFAVLILMSVPVVGGLLGMALMPVLTLGFMIASRAALAGEPVLPGQLVEGLRGEREQRKALLLLCVLYALGTIGIIELAHAVDGGSFERLQMALAGGEARSAEVSAELADPRLAQGMLVRAGLATLMSIPFWFAPALVHWGGQGVWQSLFSSTLALWRAKGAFTVYSLVWFGAMAAAGGLVALLLGSLGLRQLVGVLVVPLGLTFSVAFYVSLWFSWRDCFGEDDGGA